MNKSCEPHTLADLFEREGGLVTKRENGIGVAESVRGRIRIKTLMRYINNVKILQIAILLLGSCRNTIFRVVDPESAVAGA